MAAPSRAMERLGGWSEGEVRGRLYSEAYPAFDGLGRQISDDERFIRRALERREVSSSTGFDLTLATRDGRRLPVSVTAAPMLDVGGELLGAVEVVRDVSREREMDQLKSSLVSTVSHELRTPLTMIQGFSELLMTRNLEEGSSREALAHINASAERLGRLIDDLLSVSRIESGRLVVQLAPTDVAGVIDEVVRPFRERGGHAFRVSLDGDLPAVAADRDKLVQVMTNLVSNAVKYSAEGTEVVIAATTNGTAAEISVTDHGIGLSEEEIEKLFEKFFRADREEVRRVGGTGLGLYIVKNLVEMQGGQLWVRSRRGSGSTFSFTLPIVGGSDERIPAESGKARAS